MQFTHWSSRGCLRTFAVAFAEVPYGPRAAKLHCGRAHICSVDVSTALTLHGVKLFLAYRHVSSVRAITYPLPFAAFHCAPNFGMHEQSCYELLSGYDHLGSRSKLNLFCTAVAIAERTWISSVSPRASICSHRHRNF